MSNGHGSFVGTHLLDGFRKPETLTSAPLTWGRVICVYPKTHRLDIRLLASGAVLYGVPLLTGSAGTSHGAHALPKIANNTDERCEAGSLDTVNFTGTGDTFAIIGFLDSLGELPRSRPVALGLLGPDFRQVAFTEDDLWLTRHPSGSYWLTDKHGNYEMRFPDGSYIRVGDSLTLKSIAAIVAYPDSHPWSVPVAAAKGIALGLGDGAGGQTGVQLKLLGTDVTITATTTIISGNLQVGGVITEGGTPVSLGSPLGVGHTHP